MNVLHDIIPHFTAYKLKRYGFVTSINTARIRHFE